MGYCADSRLAERIRERVAEVVLYELQDPRITFPTITKVRLAKDLSSCKVYYSVLGSAADKSKTAHALEDATGFIQRQVAQVLRSRTMPALRFVFDESVEGGLRMQGLLDRLKKEREDAESRGQSPADPEQSEQPEQQDGPGAAGGRGD